MLTPAKEILIREALGAKVAAAAGSVFVRRPIINSKQDWAEMLGVQTLDGELEMRFCTVDLLGFSDSADEGCADDPVTRLTYRVHLFHEYQESRTDGSNSTDDFTAVVLNLRNDFFRVGDAVDGTEYLPLSQSGFIILGEDPISGGFGHFADLTAAIDVL